MPTTTGMKGGGYYDGHSQEQRAALDVFLPWLEQAVLALPTPVKPQMAWTLLDIGSSEGANAIYAMQRLIASLRHKSSRPIRVFFDDLPTNDFNHLFTNLFPDGEPALGGANIFTGTIGGTAFGRLVPSSTLHVATTFNALGFLAHKPDADLPHYILPMGPGPRAPRAGVAVSEEEREPFRLQAADDLHRFYTLRAEELISGGKLLVQVFGRDENNSTSFGIYDVLSDAILDTVEAGILPRDLYTALVFPIYFRTIDELVAPIKDHAELARTYRVEHMASHEVAVPFNQALTDNGDIAAWAEAYTGFLRAFTEAILASALPNNVDRADLLDQIYTRVMQRLIADPSRYEFHYISIGALLTRI